MVLDVQNITKKYDNQPVLNNLSFSVDKGEIIGFLGSNGAGKSTTMKIIAGCIRADDGSVLISNHSISQSPLKAKMLIGYLPENNPLYEEMYIPEYLEYVARLYATDNTEEKVKRAIVQTGLQREVHKKIGQLSKGYKQRVGLAQAIIHQPDLLILDEPTSGLDPNQMEEINNLLLSLSKDKAILFSSHTLSEVAAICTRVIIIHEGKIVADLPAGEVSDLEQLFKELTRNNS